MSWGCTNICTKRQDDLIKARWSKTHTHTRYVIMSDNRSLCTLNSTFNTLYDQWGNIKSISTLSVWSAQQLYFIFNWMLCWLFYLIEQLLCSQWNIIYTLWLCFSTKVFKKKFLIFLLQRWCSAVMFGLAVFQSKQLPTSESRAPLSNFILNFCFYEILQSK